MQIVNAKEMNRGETMRPTASLYSCGLGQIRSVLQRAAQDSSKPAIATSTSKQVLILREKM